MTKIEWVKDPKTGAKGKTWNPIVGCSKLSPGCANCYAEVMARRLKAMGRPEYQDAVNGDGKWTGRVALVPERLEEPLKRKKPTMYFVNSMSDLFHESVPDEFIERVFAAMERCKRHTFQVLTKRARRMRDFCNHPSGKHLPAFNVWLGVTAENQQTADERIPLLLQTPAEVRFVSAEPLLSAIDLTTMSIDGYGFFPLKVDSEILGIRMRHIDWLIVGGESGPHARLMEEKWAMELVWKCQAAGVPIFVKQMGSAWAKKEVYRDSKGADMRWWLPELQIRELPEVTQ